MRKSLYALFSIFLIPLASPRTVVIQPIPGGRPIPAQISLLQGTSTQIDPQYVRAYVLNASKAAGVNPVVSLWILDHESQDGRNMLGDDGNSRGYWQISSIYHPEVSTACADDLQCSTAWALARIAAGYVNEWSSWRFRCEWYQGAPNCG